MRARVIPVLLVENGGLVKTVQFKDGVYVGDPINAIRIFNDLEVDEIMVLDISASKNGRPPSVTFVKEIASECFMPLCYGGGISSLAQMEELFAVGVEKIAINHAVLPETSLVRAGAREFGSQSIVGSIDVKGSLFGRWRVYDHTSGKTIPLSPQGYALRLEEAGVGEILLTSVDRDGTMKSYDKDLIFEVSSAVGVPLIACGGASCLGDLVEGTKAGADAVAAGSMFVFQGRRRGVLINYPSQEELNAAFSGL